MKNGESLLQDEEQHARSFSESANSIKEKRFDWFSMLSSSIFILRMHTVFNVILIHTCFFHNGDVFRT